jgi:signal transduction histidine kinase
MESLKKKWGDLSLRRFFLLTVFLTIGIVAALSAVVIGVCASFRHWLLPDADAVYLTVEETLADGRVTVSMNLLKYGDDLSVLPSLQVDDGGEGVVEQRKYSIQKIERGVDTLSPRRRFAYQACGVLMVAAPGVLAFAGILPCSLYFYRKKLEEPLKLLSEATGQVARQDLDFEIHYENADEMGQLCDSFEKMRMALYENQKKMWEMMEERRILQASVAHDLRNPIAIIEGYSEYLTASIESGEVPPEKLRRIAKNLYMSAKRLERYTESVRILNQSKDMPVDKKMVPALQMAEGMAEDFSLLAGQGGIKLRVEIQLPDKEIQVDSVLLYRVLENVMSNALRFAKEEIWLEFLLVNDMLCVTVTDDGEGLPPEILSQGENAAYGLKEDGHMGIGLVVGRLLCKKHGGHMRLSNTGNGACVEICFAV